MPARSTRNNFHTFKIPEFFLADIHLVQEHLTRVLRNSAQQSVAHRARLLEDFLLHEMFEPALFRHDRVPRNMLRLPLDRASLEIHHANALRRQHRQLAIAQKEHAARMLQNRRNVTGYKESLSPKPITIGGPSRAATIFSGSRADKATNAKAPVITFTDCSTAASSDAPCEYFSIRCAMISVSVSVTNLCPSAISWCFSSR